MVFNQGHNKRQAKTPICSYSVWSTSTLAQLPTYATDFRFLDDKLKKVILLPSILNSFVIIPKI